VALGSPAEKEALRKTAEARQINLRYFDDNRVGVSLNETTTLNEVKTLVEVFAEGTRRSNHIDIAGLADTIELQYPAGLTRQSAYLTHPVFNRHHSEHEMLRYLKSLENKDLSLTHSMIRWAAAR
jgi:glycine dehydrogenase